MKGWIDTMSKEKNTERFCPFKKITDTERNASTGKTVSHELFEPCAGERCMAYCEGDVEQGIPPYCMRVSSLP